MTLLIDIGAVPEGCCSEHAIEELHKALSMPSGDDDIFRPHESLFIRQLIEQATSKGISTLDSLKLELFSWLHASKHGAPAPKPVIPNGMIRWSAIERKAAKAYLEGLPKELWSADDYMLLVDYLADKYLPPDFAVQQADWLAKRALIMGRVQAAIMVITEQQAALLMAEFEKKGALEASLRRINFHDALQSFGEAKTADYIVTLTDSVRHKMKSAILDFELGRRLGVQMDNSSLEQKLRDNFAEHNRDWRRIALTEAGELANNAFIANVAPGQKVKRIEQYANACPFCKKWNGAVLTVIAPDAKDKDWDTQVWVGKNNIGRSASPYKRVGGELVKRDDAEMLKPSAGVFHPHCRGVWVALGSKATADEFTLWLDGFLAKQAAKNPKK
jgi:hypothetical protein